MATSNRYDILFEPVKIGPVTAPNRFYQVPHCNGMGHQKPRTLAAMRGVKAEGGWGVVCTEEVEIHPSSDVSPFAEGRLWSDADIEPLRWMTDAVHEHGSLAGIELTHSGFNASNLESRVPSLAPSACPVNSYYPSSARAMTRKDIRDLRHWHRQAARRSKAAGFDIVYVYAGHNLSMLMHFMSRRHNFRTDEYGGTLENRVRLTREILEETKDEIGDTCAVAFRFAVDELIGKAGITFDGEGHDIVAMLAELPDLWDVNISEWENDSATARFEPNEGYQDKYTRFVKQLTSKPVVGVGRFTSPDLMVKKIKDGTLDLIGAARPSIADPFLPNKIRDDRIEEIRECIGCNICVSGDNLCVPMRCTQNPTVGEEWRRKWHPEKIQPSVSKDRVLVVGAGPAGLECSLQLSNRGHPVLLAESGMELGGRLLKESALPGLSSYIRVRDYRSGLLLQRSNVDIYFESKINEQLLKELDIKDIVIATGAAWKKNGVGRQHHTPIPGLENINILTPDNIIPRKITDQHVTIYDDDHYYIGGVCAEQLVRDGCTVTLITPAAKASAWTENTLEQFKIQQRLLNAGIKIITEQDIESVDRKGINARCIYIGQLTNIQSEQLLLITARDPDTTLSNKLIDDNGQASCNYNSVQSIGDCLAPGTVASAIYLGHLAAREFQSKQGSDWYTDIDQREWPSMVWPANVTDSSSI